MATIRIAQAGLGGYGDFYLRHLLDPECLTSHDAAFVGGIDPFPERCNKLDVLKEQGVPVYASMAEFFAKDRADVMILPLGIHLHAPLTVEALRAGCHVVCEKPLGPTLDAAREMIAAREATGLPVAIGYQWSYSEAIQGLKRDVLDGKLGKPVRLKTMVLWPRVESYYERNGWAGRKTTDGGAVVYDSPANNATSHYLHNMLFLLGDAPDRAARPATLDVELARAKPIENFDTGAFRITTSSGVEVLFYCTHSTQKNIGPLFDFEFEKARVQFVNGEEGIEATFADGTKKSYGTPNQDPHNKLWHMVETVRGGPGPLCPPEAAMMQTAVIHAAQEAVPEIHVFPAASIRESNAERGRLLWVEGLEAQLQAAYAENRLPCEAGATWAKTIRVEMAALWKGL